MVDLSIVIAAYNEEKRLPQTLERYFRYFKTIPQTYEIVIVDDGSRDRTKTVVEELCRIHPELRLLSHFPNRGRGFSIREGILAAEGHTVLETDADGSVDLGAVGRFLKYFQEHPDTDVLIGSRELSNSRITLPQPFLRVLLGKGFIYLAQILFGIWDIHDFTLGFKMFRKKAAKDIFARQFDDHYVAEAEIVFVSKSRGWKVAELPVIWSDNRDSRVRPLRDSLRSLKGLSKVLWQDMQGKYRK